MTYPKARVIITGVYELAPDVYDSADPQKQVEADIVDIDKFHTPLTEVLSWCEELELSIELESEET